MTVTRFYVHVTNFIHDITEYPVTVLYHYQYHHSLLQYQQDDIYMTLEISQRKMCWELWRCGMSWTSSSFQGERRWYTHPDAYPQVNVTKREKKKAPLEKYVEAGILAKVEEPTLWCSNVLIRETPSKFRVCTDPSQNVNKYEKFSYPQFWFLHTSHMSKKHPQSKCKHEHYQASTDANVWDTGENKWLVPEHFQTFQAIKKPVRIDILRSTLADILIDIWFPHYWLDLCLYFTQAFKIPHLFQKYVRTSNLQKGPKMLPSWQN